jgi:hypothetical protein
VYQFLFSLPLILPMGVVSTPTIKPMEVPSNLYNGMLCFLGYGTVNSGCHPDAFCGHRNVDNTMANFVDDAWSWSAAWIVNVALFCNIFYTLFMMLILKYGSTSILFLALTILVPLGNAVFAIPNMPGRASLHETDIVAVVVIVLGLGLYRFTSSRSDKPVSQAMPMTSDVGVSCPSDRHGLLRNNEVVQSTSTVPLPFTSTKHDEVDINPRQLRRTCSGNAIDSALLRKAQQQFDDCLLRQSSGEPFVSCDGLQTTDDTPKEQPVSSFRRHRSVSITNPLDPLREPLLARSGDV